MSHTDPDQSGTVNHAQVAAHPGTTEPPVGLDSSAAVEAPATPPASAAAAGVAQPAALQITWAQEVWDSARVPTLPTMLTRTDGQRLLYPGKAHTIAGEPGAGKSWLAQAAIAQVLTTIESPTFYLDFEATDIDVVARLQALGVTVDQAADRFAYLRADTSQLEQVMELLLAAVTAHAPALLVIDGLASAMAAAGMDENSNKDAARWHRQVVVPLNDAGVTTVTVDHISKASAANGAVRTGYARGASAKLADITGAAYLLTSRTPFSAQSPGLSELVVMKDRFGRIGTRGEVVAHVHFTPALSSSPESTGMQVRLDRPPGAHEAAAGLRAEIIAALAHRGPLNRTKLRAAVRGNNTRINGVITTLLTDGVLTQQGEGRGGTLLALAHSLANEADELGEPSPPG